MKFLYEGAIHISDLRLWAHVGVLQKEQEYGQWFNLDISIYQNIDNASKNDDLSETIDYSIAINKIQKLAHEVNSKTIENFSEQVLNSLEELYGSVPMRVLLSKCDVPVSGFNGNVAVERYRHWPATYFQHDT